MRRLITLAACALAFALTAAAAAQERLYTSDEIEYAFDLPNPTWRPVPRSDGVHTHVEFIYGDRSDGLLRIRKEVVGEGVKLSDVAERDLDNKLRYLPNLVEGKREDFPGRLGGIAARYEYTQGGKPTAARIYYLQADPRTVYVLHFTGRRDTLLRLRAQTDLIARTFRIK